MQDTMNQWRIDAGHPELIVKVRDMCLANEVVIGWQDEYEYYLPA